MSEEELPRKKWVPPVQDDDDEVEEEEIVSDDDDEESHVPSKREIAVEGHANRLANFIVLVVCLGGIVWAIKKVLSS